MQPYHHIAQAGPAGSATVLPRRHRLRRAQPPAGASDDNPAGTIVGAPEWTLVYVGFLLYIFAVVTYRFPIATPAMILATVGLFVQREKLRLPLAVGLFGVYILWGLIGYTQTQYPQVVWERIVLLSKVWLIMLVAVNALRSRSQIRFFMVFFLACFATHPARGTIFNYVNGYTEFGRAAWNYVFGNPNDMAALTFFPLAIAAGLLNDRNKWVHRGALASIVVLPIVIFLTQSRGAFLALALFAALTWIGQRRKLRTLLILVVLAGIVISVAPSGMWERVTALSEQGKEADSSSKQRYAIWQIAGEIIRDHPLMGVGLGAYSRTHEQYAPSVETEFGASGTRDTHSTYLNVAAEVGYPGLLIFIGIVVSAALVAERTRRRIKRDSPDAAARLWYLEAGLLAYMTAAIFGSFSQLALLYLHLALLLAMAQTLDKDPRAARLQHRRIRTGQVR